MKRNFIYWLRWIVVLPGSLVFSFLALFPLNWILYFILEKGSILSEVSTRSIEYFLTPFVIAIVFILAGFKIAPKYKFQASITLTILWIILFVGIFVFMPMNNLQLQFEVRSIGVPLGLLFGLYIAWRKSKHGSNALI